MSRTLYLHIGVQRTATTAIQSFMRANFHALLKRGYLYPFGVPRHFALFDALFCGRRTIDGLAADLDARCGRWPQPVKAIVLSDEGICLRHDLSPLARLRDHFDVRIVMSLRRQDTWLESWYLQNIKWQWNPDLGHCTFDQFLARRDEFHWIRYERFVSHLEDLFGAENLRLQVFEKEQMPDGPLAAFCRLIGLDATAGFRLPQAANPSFSAAMSEFMRHLPLDRMAQPDRKIVVDACKAIDRAPLGNAGMQGERLLSPERRRAILAEYDDGNAALARRHFGRDRLFLAPLPDAGAPLAALALPRDSKVLLRDYVAPLFEELVRRGLVAARPTFPAGNMGNTVEEGAGA